MWPEKSPVAVPFYRTYDVKGSPRRLVKTTVLKKLAWRFNSFWRHISGYAAEFHILCVPLRAFSAELDEAKIARD